ncbi:GPI inositol deacylase [Coemansia sp. RSA 1939]|nr:GPI inositol deacylase [Coemansia sp. RSA 1939]KAJ2605967.1 GPI inositol deacylase [Coemansia sp. RSA 1804]KAJ2685191.1 GPI inositol deacylase [Coemansia sp. RSA 1285]
MATTLNSNENLGSSSGIRSASTQKRTGTPPEEGRAVEDRQQSHDLSDRDNTKDPLLIKHVQEESPLRDHVSRRLLSVTKQTGVLCVMLVSVIVGLLAALSYFNNQPDMPGCAMSYSRPRYIEQAEFSRSWTRYSIKYKLYLYREGGYDAIDDPFRIPVLFVPGNAGSHKQVRSMASSSASAFVELIGEDPSAVDRGQIGYDFFTVGLNEEFTALHGYSILEQAEFVNDAIRYILSLYPKTRTVHRLSNKDTAFALPTSVIVVGHSMGGVVARTAFTLSNYVNDSIQAIFTLSTPHNNPTASLEQYVEDTYSNVNAFWRNGFNNGSLDHVSLVSIAGGNLDSMINSDYTYVGDIAPPKNSLSIMSSGINDVWLSLDHQNILWCAQMAKKFSRVMLQIMDARQPSQLLSLESRMNLMRRELYSGTEADGFVENERTVLPKDVLSSDYQYVNVYDSGTIKLTLADMRELIPKSKKSIIKPKALHLLPFVDKKSKAGLTRVLQVLYDPRLFANSDDTNKKQDARPIFLGCNQQDAKENAKFVCKQLPEPTSTMLPLKRLGDNPELPVDSLRYMEILSKGFEGYSHIGFELPSHPGKTGFLEAAFVNTPLQVDKDPGYLQLITPYSIRAQLGDGVFGLRSRIRLVVPENPLFVFRTKVAMHRNSKASHALSNRPRFSPVVLQSDGRHYESKFWYDQSVFDIAIHGRGTYFQTGHLTTTSKDSPRLAGSWDGLYIDLFADTDYYSGFDISLRINWYSSLNRMIKRYDMALLALSFIWACLVLVHQLHSWNSQMQLRFESQGSVGGSGIAVARFPGCLATIEHLIRNGTLVIVLVISALTPIIQELVSYAMEGSWSSATLASWNNLFMGVRGSGWTLCLPPMLLVLVSLGFIILEAIVLTIVCGLASWVVAMVASVLGEGNPLVVAAEASVLENTKDRGRYVSSDNASVYVRPAIIAVVFVFLVSAVLPYQFAFLVIYLAQTITTVRTMTYSQIMASGAARQQDSKVAHASLTERHSQEDRRVTKRTAAMILKDRSAYQLALLLFWTSSLPYCVPELLVWVRNISVLWFEDAPSDHNLANMAGYFALRTLATYHIVPRLGSVSEHRSSRLGWRIVRGLRIATFGIFACSVIYAWLFSIRRPYTLYNIGNIISAWLSIVQFANYPLRLVSAAYKAGVPLSAEPRRTQSAEELHSFSWADPNTHATKTTLTSTSDDYLDRKVR